MSYASVYREVEGDQVVLEKLDACRSPWGLTEHNLVPRHFPFKKWHNRPKFLADLGLLDRKLRRWKGRSEHHYAITDAGRAVLAVLRNRDLVEQAEQLDLF